MFKQLLKLVTIVQPRSDNISKNYGNKRTQLRKMSEILGADSNILSFQFH